MPLNETEFWILESEGRVGGINYLLRITFIEVGIIEVKMWKWLSPMFILFKFQLNICWSNN